MSERDSIFDTVKAQIEPFNKKGVTVTEATTFQGDLEWDSLTVMDFVAAIEDEFDIIITMNMQAEIETVGQLVDAGAAHADERELRRDEEAVHEYQEEQGDDSEQIIHVGTRSRVASWSSARRKLPAPPGGCSGGCVGDRKWGATAKTPPSGGVLRARYVSRNWEAP